MTVSNVFGDSTSIGTPLDDHIRNPNAHHNQVHNLYGPDHGDVDLTAALSRGLGLFYDEALGKFSLESRTKVYFQPTQPVMNGGDLWVVTT